MCPLIIIRYITGTGDKWDCVAGGGSEAGNKGGAAGMRIAAAVPSRERLLFPLLSIRHRLVVIRTLIVVLIGKAIRRQVITLFASLFTSFVGEMRYRTFLLNC